eukprot:scaffold125008_cov24-Prasinocladus_malaysianus.AAC.1
MKFATATATFCREFAIDKVIMLGTENQKPSEKKTLRQRSARAALYGEAEYCAFCLLGRQAKEESVTFL